MIDQKLLDQNLFYHRKESLGVREFTVIVERDKGENMSPRFPRVTGKEMVEFLQSRGPNGKTVVVPVRGSETLGIGITRKILKQSGIDIEEFLEYFR